MHYINGEIQILLVKMILENYHITVESYLYWTWTIDVSYRFLYSLSRVTLSTKDCKPLTDSERLPTSSLLSGI